MKMIAMVLIILGVLAVGYQGLTYVTREKVVDLGPIEVTKEEHKTLPLPPIAGGVCLVAGVILVVAGGRRAA